MTTDRIAAFKLLEKGTLVDFEVKNSSVTDSPDGESKNVTLEFQLGRDEEGEDVEWGAFGFVFVLGALSFNDARPRGYSEGEFIEQDELTLADFFEGLSFVRGELHYAADYIRGRCVKTDISVRGDGLVTLVTRGRGESALHWPGRLRGKKTVKLVP